MVSSKHSFRTIYPYRLGALTASALVCVGSVISCAPKSTPDPANNARWQNYLKDSAGANKAAEAAYQRRQSEIAKKRAEGGATPTAPSPSETPSSGKTTTP